MAKVEASAAELPVTVKLTDAARSLGVTPKEFRAILAQHRIPVLRPTVKRERILEDHLHELCRMIAGPAQRERATA